MVNYGDPSGGRLQGIDDTLMPRIRAIQDKFKLPTDTLPTITPPQQEQPLQDPGVIEKPPTESTKSVKGWFYNLGNDMLDFAKGFIAMVPAAVQGVRDVAKDIDWVPSVLWGRNKDAMAKELTYLGKNLVKGFTDTYKDGLGEALYTHPFTVFTDATMVADILAGGVRYGGRIASKMELEALKSEAEALRVAGKMTPELSTTLGTRALQIGTKTEKLANFIAGTPYLPFTGPFKLTNMLLEGPLKEWSVGKAWQRLKSTTMTDKWSAPILQIIGTRMGPQERLEAATKFKDIFAKQLSFNPEEAEHLLNVVFDEPEAKLKSMPRVESVAHEMKRVFASEDYMKAALGIWTKGHLLPEGVTQFDLLRTASAKSKIAWQYKKKIDKAVKSLGEGNPLVFDEMGNALKNEAEIKAHYNAEYNALPKEYFHKLAKELPPDAAFTPFLYARDFDPIELVDRLSKLSKEESGMAVGPLEKRTHLGDIDWMPERIIVKHVMMSEHELAIHGAMQEVLEYLDANGGLVKLTPDTPIPEGFRTLDSKYMLGRYFDAYGHIRADQAYTYYKLVNDGMSPEDALKQLFLQYGATAKEQFILEKGQKEIQRAIMDGVDYAVPESVAKIIETHFAVPGPLRRTYNNAIGWWRKMALNLFPRFYLNNAVGNTLISLLSGTSFETLEHAGNRAHLGIVEPTQHIYTIDSSPFVPSSMQRVMHSVLDTFSKTIEEQPRMKLLYASLKDAVDKARLTSPYIAGKLLYQTIDEVATEILKNQLRAKGLGPAVAREGTALQEKIDRYYQAIQKRNELQAKVDEMAGANGTTIGQSIEREMVSLETDRDINAEVITNTRKQLAAHEATFKMVKEQGDRNISSLNEDIDNLVMEEFFENPHASAEEAMEELWNQPIANSVFMLSIGPDAAPNEIRQWLSSMRSIAKVDKRLQILGSAQDGWRVELHQLVDIISEHPEIVSNLVPLKASSQPLRAEIAAAAQRLHKLDEQVKIHSKNISKAASALERVRATLDNAIQDISRIEQTHNAQIYSLDRYDRIIRASPLNTLIEASQVVPLHQETIAKLLDERVKAQKQWDEIRIHSEAARLRRRGELNRAIYDLNVNLEGVSRVASDIGALDTFTNEELDLLFPKFAKAVQRIRDIEKLAAKDRAEALAASARLSAALNALANYELQKGIILTEQGTVIGSSINKTLALYGDIPIKVIDEGIAYQRAKAALITQLNEVDSVIADNNPLFLLGQTGSSVDALRRNRPLLMQEYKLYRQAVTAMETWFGNYNSMHPLERRIMRQIFPFWTFTKTMFTLMWRLPGLRPKTTRLWLLFSKYFMDATEDDNLHHRYQGMIPVGGDKNGNIIMLRVGSLSPFDTAGVQELADGPAPRVIDPAANPFLRVLVETRGGYDTFTDMPFKDKDEFITPTGEVLRWDMTQHKLIRVTPEKPLLDAALSLVPHWRFLQELIMPNASVPKDPDGNPRYDRSWYQAIPRLFGFPVTVRNPDQIMRNNMLQYKQLMEQFKLAARRDPDTRKALEAIQNDVINSAKVDY